MEIARSQNIVNVTIAVAKFDFNSSAQPLKIRIFSEWLKCCGISSIMGEGDIPWNSLPNDEKISTLSLNFESDLSTKESITIFHKKPGIYAVFLSENKPVGFTFIDCSSFLVEGGSLSANNVSILDYTVNMTVSVPLALLPKKELLTLEPVFIDIKSINSYPLLRNELPEEAVQSTFVFGQLDLGCGLTRAVFGTPFIKKKDALFDNNDGNVVDTKSSTKLGSDFQIDLKVCLLPGLIDIPKVKDSFTSSTLILELHRDDVFKRAFHTRNVEEYNKLEPLPSAAELAALAATTQAASPKKKPTKPAATGGKNVAASADNNSGSNNLKPNVGFTSPPTSMTEGDIFLSNIIQHALLASRQVKPHGTIRFRLEQLLSSSNDLLARFAKKRMLSQSAVRNSNDDDDDDIVVKENMLIEVRLEKPSKPEKWDLPADISLKSALLRAKEESKSRLDGTLALNSTVKSTGTTLANGRRSNSSNSVAIQQQQRHEMFFTAGTAVELTASLYRKLLPPPHSTATTITATTAVDNNQAGRSSSKSKARKSSTVAANNQATAQPLASSSLEVSEGKGNGLNDVELLRKLAVTPFTRMIVQFKYIDDDALRGVMNGVTEVNSAALPDIQGTIRSYSFTNEERSAAENATLDVITGFMIIDDDKRLVVLEGLAAPGCGMQRLFTEFLPRLKPNDDQLRIICNPEVLFPNRMYPDFGPDIRRIRIRDKLKKLARRPEIYNRKQVEELCFVAVDAIMSLRRAADMLSTKTLNMYPTAAALNKLELLYGEAITRPDMDGTLRDAFVENFAVLKESQRLHHPSNDAMSVNSSSTLHSHDASSHHSNSNNSKSLLHSPSHDTSSAIGSVLANAGVNSNALLMLRSSSSRVAHSHSAAAAGSTSNTQLGVTLLDRKHHDPYQPADCRNPDFEDHLRSRPQHRIDHLEETKQLREQAWEAMLRRREKREQQFTDTLRQVLDIESAGKDKGKSGKASAWKRDDDDEEDEDEGPIAEPKIYLYSQQTLNFKSKAFEVLRQRIAKDRDATYTFSKDFVSQTVCSVDEEQDRKKDKAQSEAEWLTSRGFLYPKPKTRKELMTHPQRPSDARIDELQEPFRDATDERCGAAGTVTADPVLRELEKGFMTQIASSEGGLFGALKPPEFEHPFQLKLIGHPTSLPRGSLTAGLEPDPDCFRSVHLGGEQQAKIVEEALRKEKQEWLEKVRVDSLTMKVSGFNVRDRPIQMDRNKDILKDEPQCDALRHLRSRYSHRGADWSLEPITTCTINNVDGYRPNAAINALVRTTQPQKFITNPNRDKFIEDSKNPNRTMNYANTTTTGGGGRRRGGSTLGSNTALSNMNKSPVGQQRGNSSSGNLHSATGVTTNNNNKSTVALTSSGAPSQLWDEEKYGPRPVDFQRYIHSDTYNSKMMSMIAKRKHPPQDKNSNECTGPKWEGIS